MISCKRFQQYKRSKSKTHLIKKFKYKKMEKMYKTHMNEKYLDSNLNIWWNKT